MRIGDIKIEALKLMFVNYNVAMEIDDIPRLEQDENYGSYLINMPGAMNRCFSRIEEKGVLPSKAHTLKNGETTNGYVRYDLNAIVDFDAIDRVVCQDTSGYNGNCEYQIEANFILLPTCGNDYVYRLLYRPKITRITAMTDNNAELYIPEAIASSIPYFIKGELYREDEPSEASEARNWFESAMSENNRKVQATSNVVKNVYSQTEI